MEYLPNGLSLELSTGTFPLSTDSMVLADFVSLKRNARVLDLGSGCGTLGLLLCASHNSCTVTGIELDKKAHLQAINNIRTNALESRLYSICADLRAMPAEITRQSFQCCVSNPPYFSGGSPSTRTPMARQDDSCSLAQLFAAANYALQYGGDFFLVHKPEKLASICFEACKARLEPKVLRTVRYKPDACPSLILLQCRKGGKPGLRFEEITLFQSDGSPTEEYRRIYHL